MKILKIQTVLILFPSADPPAQPGQAQAATENKKITTSNNKFFINS